jgi:hypothetical protein
VNPAEFDALFDAARSTIFRLEQLPAYAVGGAEEDRIRAFREGRPRPERSVRTSAWMARIAVTTVAGKSWSRVRVVDQPLTEYERYELESYRESQAVGESISIVLRSTVEAEGPDFWLFDGGTEHARAVLMHYTDDGRLDRRELVEDAELLATLQARREAASATAMPLNEFLVSGLA